MESNTSNAFLESIAISFLLGEAPDHRGLTVKQYFDMSEDDMECDHQWVQWAFPINTESPHNPYAGRLFSKKTNLPEVFYKNQKILLKQYLNTIGIRMTSYGAFVAVPETFAFVVDNRYNHHVKRISRVIKHLMLTDRAYVAERLVKTLNVEIVGGNAAIDLNSWTVAYWNAIVGGYDELMNTK